MQKYTILGIKLYDYGAREALRNTDSFLHNGALNTIAYISSSNLAQASKDEQLRECLEMCIRDSPYPLCGGGAESKMDCRTAGVSE